MAGWMHAWVDIEKKAMIRNYEWCTKKMPKIDTLDALKEHEEHEDDYQTNSNW